MSTQINDVLAAMCKRIALERKTYNSTLGQKRERKICLSASAMYWDWKCAQARLSYLVPLYRALLAAAQQVKQKKMLGGNYQTMGVQHYQMKFTALKFRMQHAVRHTYSTESVEWYFGHGLEDLQVPVPVPGQAVDAWEIKTIRDLLTQTNGALAVFRAEQDAAREKRLKQAKAAEFARLGLLRSLTSEQQQLLRAAFGANNIVSIEARDLVHLEKQ